MPKAKIIHTEMQKTCESENAVERKRAFGVVHPSRATQTKSKNAKHSFTILPMLPSPGGLSSHFGGGRLTRCICCELTQRGKKDQSEKKTGRRETEKGLDDWSLVADEMGKMGLWDEGGVGGTEKCSHLFSRRLLTCPNTVWAAELEEALGEYGKYTQEILISHAATPPNSLPLATAYELIQKTAPWVDRLVYQFCGLEDYSILPSLQPGGGG